MTYNFKEYAKKNFFFLTEAVKLFNPKLLINSKKHNYIDFYKWAEINPRMTNVNMTFFMGENYFYKVDHLSSTLGFMTYSFLFYKTNNNSWPNSKLDLGNIYLLELIGNYRGWRHMSGLPVRGQRTWTNAWSVYRSNLGLRELTVSLAKKFYSVANLSIKKVSMAAMAEHVNRLWSIQWEKDWRRARKKRLKALTKDYRSFKVDVARLALGNVNTKKARKNRKKQAAEKRNNFILGFDKGFTRYLLEHNVLEDPTKPQKTMRRERSTALEKKRLENLTKNTQVSFGESEHKKKTIKKKTSKAEILAQMKKAKLAKAKRKKKSVWD